MAHCEKPTYVVRSYVGDFNFQCFGLPMGSVKPLQGPKGINTSFQLQSSAARCETLYYLKICKGSIKKVNEGLLYLYKERKSN